MWKVDLAKAHDEVLVVIYEERFPQGMGNRGSTMHFIPRLFSPSEQVFDMRLNSCSKERLSFGTATFCPRSGWTCDVHEPSFFAWFAEGLSDCELPRGASPCYSMWMTPCSLPKDLWRWL